MHNASKMRNRDQNQQTKNQFEGYRDYVGIWQLSYILREGRENFEPMKEKQGIIRRNTENSRALGN